MTLAMLHADPGRSGRGSRVPARRRRPPAPHWVPVIITGTSVWSALSIVTWAVPPAPTPGNAAQAYAEARMDQDWAAMWEVLCSAVPFPDREAFVAHMAESDEGFRVPPATDVFVRDVDREEGSAARPSFTVTVVVTGYDWNGVVGISPTVIGTSTIQVPVVLEAGEFRVCLDQA